MTNQNQLCSAWVLVLGFLCARAADAEETGNHLHSQTTRVSYKQTKSDTSKLLDLSASATSPVGGFLMPAQTSNKYYRNQPGLTTQNIQPSVYHSIIDRSTASTQLASPVQATTATVGDLNTAAGHHHGHAHGKYYEYREVPKKKTWKFGYKRGNHKHTIERHEHGKAGKHPHFKTKVKWHDKKSKGKGKFLTGMESKKVCNLSLSNNRKFLSDHRYPFVGL